MAGHEAIPGQARRMTRARDTLSASRRLLPAARIEPGIDAALEARERLQALGVGERQQLHQDHAGDVARRVDPEIGVGKARPGEAAGAAALRASWRY